MSTKRSHPKMFVCNRLSDYKSLFLINCFPLLSSWSEPNNHLMIKE